MIYSKVPYMWHLIELPNKCKKTVCKCVFKGKRDAKIIFIKKPCKETYSYLDLLRINYFSLSDTIYLLSATLLYQASTTSYLVFYIKLPNIFTRKNESYY
jgi:hypothetical protein